MVKLRKLRRVGREIGQEFKRRSKKAFTLTETEKKQVSSLKKRIRSAPKRVRRKLHRWSKNIDFHRAF